MPFISDEELLDYTTQIEEAKEEKRVTNYAHSKALRDEREQTRKFKITTMILGILALLGVAGTTYFLSTSPPLPESPSIVVPENTAVLQEKIDSLEETLHVLKENDSSGMTTIVNAQSKEIEVLQQTIADLEIQLERAATATPTENNINTEKKTKEDTEESENQVAEGTLDDQIVYTVQISAHKDQQLPLYSDRFVNLKEIQAGGYYKYSLGNFDSLEEAKEYRKHLKKVGIPKTFIASYQYGKRLRIEDVR